jgi:hypothetical protein
LKDAVLAGFGGFPGFRALWKNFILCGNPILAALGIEFSSRCKTANSPHEQPD